MHERLTYVHFDTQDSVSNTDPFASTFTLSNVIRNPHKIYLKSTEIPISFTNIRASNYTNFLTVLCHGITVQILIPEQQYTNQSVINNQRPNY